MWPVVTVHNQSFLQLIVPNHRLPVSRASVKKNISVAPQTCYRGPPRMSGHGNLVASEHFALPLQVALVAS